MSIQEEVSSALKKNSNLKMDHLNELGSKLDEIEIDFEEPFYQLKVDVWLKKAKLICDMCNPSGKIGRNSASETSHKITYNNLRNYLVEGY